MELAFNEISQTPLLDDKYQANKRMLLFSKAVAEARKKGFRNIRTHYSAAEINLLRIIHYTTGCLIKNFQQKGGFVLRYVCATF